MFIYKSPASVESYFIADAKNEEKLCLKSYVRN